MKILLIEDEELAANRLMKLLLELRPEAQVLGVLDSIHQAEEWFAQNAMPDILITDIQLADGPVFRLFSKIKLNCPVIFCTAYDQFALDSFKVNSVHYLLKPIKSDQLAIALDRAAAFTKQEDLPNLNLLLRQLKLNEPKEYQSRIIVKIGHHYKTVEIAQVAYFFTEDQVVFAKTFSGSQVPLDYQLDKLEDLLDPKVFFRTNRQFIVNIKTIEKMTVHTKGRLRLNLNPPTNTEVITSTERSPSFKQWLTGEV